MGHDLLGSDTQDAREQDYATSGVFTKKTDARDLHMFFSPYMVPAGLTDGEVRICLELSKRKENIGESLLRKKRAETKAEWLQRFHEDRDALENERSTLSGVFGDHAFDMTAEEIADLFSHTVVVTYQPVTLPRELIQSPMTREAFVAGVKALIELMDTLERKEG